MYYRHAEAGHGTVRPFPGINRSLFTRKQTHMQFTNQIMKSYISSLVNPQTNIPLPTGPTLNMNIQSPTP